MRAHRRITAALLCALVGCAGGVGGRRPLLREYRVVAPKRQVVQPVWLAAFTTDEVGGRLSPDGRALLYAGDQKGSLDIWVKDLTTGIPRRLTSHVAIDTQPAWSPDGKRVVFVSMRKDVKGDLYLWEGGEPSQLTDRRAAEAYPTFAPDGRSIYMASGPEGLTRIERLDLKSKERTPLTDWDATHPAVSSDGRLLAYTQFDENRRGRIAVLDLQTRKARLLTTPEYHAGFPTFSRDGKRLLFSRFTVGSPQAPIQPDTAAAVASLWEVDLRRALAAGSPERAMALARPLTSGRYTVLFAQDSGFGLVFTTSRAGSLDVGMLPESGPVPRLATAAAQLALARAQDNPRDRLLCLDYVQRFGRGAEASRARYLMASIHRELEEFDPARRILEGLARERSEEAQLARIDLVALPVEQQAARGKVDAVVVHRALRRLGALSTPSQPTSGVAAHLVLRRGDLQRLGGRVQAAIKSYETLVERHPEVREAAVQAKFHLGTLFARVRDPDLLATYYLTLFAQYPEQGEWLRRAGQAVLALYKGRPPEEQVEIFRALVDAHPRCALFGARAEIRIGQLYEQLDQLDLAIAAMARVTRAYGGPAVVRERTEAAFELGRLSLANYERLREAGRLSEALSFYDKALAAYAQVLKTFEPGHEHHTRARTEFLRLSLLMAAQLERDGETALAEKRYRALLAIDPENLQAHRKLIELGVGQGRRDALRREYDERVDRDPGDAVGHYGLGYLATFPAGEALSASELDRAEEHLKRATSLSPQSPFGHMTLGWVFEMRERLLGQSGRGWLEEAIDLYDRAYSLNDAKIDVQTEADLLVNLCNSFANLGNGWRQALEFCDKRRALKIPFISKQRAAAYHLTFGRAASAMGVHELADEQLEKAYDLARDLDVPRLEAEVVSRRALTAHLQGDTERSNRYFLAAMELYRKHGRQELLPGLSRSVALNLVLAHQHHKALEQLAESGALLDKHAPPAIEPFMAVEKVGCTTAPYGFDKADESYIALALKQQVFRARQEWHAVAPLLEQRIASRKKALEEREHQELARETVLLQNNLGLARLKLGQPGAFAKSLQTAIAAVEKMQTDEKTGELTPDAELFPLLVALELNRAEQLLAALVAGDAASPSTLREHLGRLQRLEQLRAAQVAKENKPLLGPRLRLSLFADLALLSFHDGLSAGPPAAAGKGPRPPAAERAVQQLASSAKPFATALRLLRRVMAETDPERVPEDAEALTEAREAAAERGVLEPLWWPLSRREELRWYLAAALNLVRLSAAFAPAEQLADHPSTSLLRELAALGLRRELGAWRFAIAAELAYRRADPRAMELAVRGFLDHSPLLLEGRGTAQAARLRQLVFGRAVALALRKPDLAAAVAWAEQEERRGFSDELVALPPTGWGRAAKPLKALLDAAAAYRRHLAREPVTPTPAATATPAATPTPAAPDPWRAQLNKLEQAFAERRRALAKLAPRVAALFEVPEFPQKPLLGALAEGDVAVTALVSEGKVLLVALAPNAEPAAAPVKQDLAALRRPGQLERALAPILARLVKGARRVYIDLGRIDPALKPQRLLPKGARGVRLATLWELVDAHAVRNLALSGGRVADARPDEAKRVARTLGFKAITGDKLRLARVDLPFEQAGFLLWNQPLRFDGGPATNVRLPLFDPKGQRLDDLRLGRALGLPLRGHLLALVSPRHTPGRERVERVALLRLAHAMGVPAVLVLDSATQVQQLKPLLAQLERSDLAGAVQTSASKGATLFGYGGMEPDAAVAFAKAQLGATARAGVGAFGKRDLSVAVEQLEATLRYIDYLQDFKYLDGALEFLAQSYTLLEDYRRAVPLMKRLLALRAEVIEKERKAGGKKVLAAQAKWVKALTDMAWLRMRNKEYDAALAANKQAIALYHEVKRPLLALDSYVQRAIIAEKKGDNRQALTYAQKALQTARTALAKSPKSTGAQSDVAAAAGRVARYQRMLFSNYRAAMTAARLALEHIPAVKPEERAAVETEGRALMAKKAALQAKAKDKPKDKAVATQLAATTKQLTALVARHKAMGKALGDRVQAVLEVSRIQSARGDYNRAADSAEQALELARAAKLSDAEPALLELVNNLYYTGAFGPALARASEGLSLAKPVRRIQFHNARGSIYAALGQTAEAKTELEAALSIATRLKNPAEMAASHNNLGNALRLAGRFDGAKRQFRKALEIDRRREDKLGMAFDYANLGLTEELMGRARDAAEHLERALALSRQIGAPLNELKALTGLGRMSMAAGQAKQALDRFRRGQRIATRLGLRNWSWRFDLLEGRALRRLRQLGPARAALERGLKLIEGRPPRLRKALGVPKVEEEPEDLYDELVDLLAQQNQAEAAFDVSERLRARGFIDLVSQSSTGIPLEQARDKIKAITRLQQELEAARAAEMRATAAADRKDAAQEVQRAQAELDAARNALAAINPRLPSMVVVDAWPLARLRSLVGPSHLVLSYVPTPERLVIFALQGSKLRMQVVRVSRQELTRTVQRYREALLRFHPVQDLSRKLYRWLLAPALGKDSPERLVIVPAGALHLLPFAALEDERGRPLVERHVLSYLASVNHLRQPVAAGADAGAKRGKKRGAARRVAFGWAGKPPHPLSFTVREAEAFGVTFPGATVVNGPDATRARLLEEVPAADLIHVATHGEFHEEAPLRTALQLADGSLPLLEVLGLVLKPGALVILSACETGTGQLDGADAAVALNQAFLAAGADRVVSSLYRVSDLGAALLMKHLFRRLAAGVAPARALREAQQHLRQRFPHPAFWAAFRLDGAP